MWSFAGDDDREDVNAMLIQPFLNYNLPDGWYLSSSPIIAENWEAGSDYTWLVPVGGGVGKIFRIGNQPMNAQVQAFYNVEKLEVGGLVLEISAAVFVSRKQVSPARQQ